MLPTGVPKLVSQPLQPLCVDARPLARRHHQQHQHQAASSPPLPPTGGATAAAALLAAGIVVVVAAAAPPPASAYNVRLEDVQGAPVLQSGLRAATEGRLDEAERLFKLYLLQLQQQQPPDEGATASAWSNLGNVHQQQGRAALAVEDFTRAVQLAPQVGGCVCGGGGGGDILGCGCSASNRPPSVTLMLLLLP